MLHHSGDGRDNKEFHAKMFSFMVTDFYIRTIPLVCLMVLIHCSNEEDVCLPTDVLIGVWRIIDI